MPLPRHLRNRMAALPPALLAPHETLAREVLGSSPDRAKAAGRFLHTAAGREAMAALAAEAFDRGRAEEALRAWILLHEVRPSPVLAARAAGAASVLGEIPLLRVPDGAEKVLVAGRPTPVGDYLHALAVGAPAGPGPLPGRRPPHEVLLGRYDLRLDGGAFAPSLAVSIPAVSAWKGREVVLFTNGIRVAALDPVRGEGGSLEDAVLWKYPPGENPVREMPTPFDSPRNPQPYLGVAVSEGRAFATMFSRDSRARLHGRRPDRFDGPAAIRAFDLGTGKLLWDTDDLVIDVEGESLPMLEALRFGQKNFCFTGPPEVRGDRLLVAVMTTPLSERECHILCLDAATGRTLWTTWVASAFRPGWGTLVPSFIEDGGRVYVQSSFGVVAALETETGAIEWLVRYGSTGSRSAVSLPLVVGGRVVFLPQDRSDPVILDRRTGREAPLPPLSTPVAWWRTQHLAGAWGSGFAASGSPGVAVDTADGRVVELPSSDGGRLWRGAAAGGRMYLPGAKALAIYDMSTWTLVDSAPWPFPGEAGNLVLAGDLCLALSDRLSVTTGAAALEDRFRARTESSPPDADACLRAAMILERSGRPLDAAAHYRRALFAMEGDPSRSAAIGEIRERLKEACGY